MKPMLKILIFAALFSGLSLYAQDKEKEKEIDQNMEKVKEVTEDVKKETEDDLKKLKKWGMKQKKLKKVRIMLKQQ